VTPPLSHAEIVMPRWIAQAPTLWLDRAWACGYREHVIEASRRFWGVATPRDHPIRSPRQLLPG